MWFFGKLIQFICFRESKTAASVLNPGQPLLCLILLLFAQFPFYPWRHDIKHNRISAAVDDNLDPLHRTFRNHLQKKRINSK